MRFPVVARALSTPLPARPGLTSIVVNFNGLSLATAKDKEGTGYLAETTVVTRAVDPAEAEVVRVSQQYPFTADGGALSAAGRATMTGRQLTASACGRLGRCRSTSCRPVYELKASVRAAERVVTRSPVFTLVP